MNLNQLISDSVSYEIHAIGEDKDLAREIQERLIDLGILDPPADSMFGPQSRAALRLFGERAGVDAAAGIDPRAATRLLEVRADDLYPIDLDDDFVSRIIRFMQMKGYWIARPQGYLNIVYVEGVNENGVPNGNPPNQFNDRRMLISIENGRPTIVGNWEATSEPGRYYTNLPPPGVRTIGVARIALGQFKAWGWATIQGSPGTTTKRR